MGYGTHIGKVAKENEMRELAVQVNLLVSSVDGNPIAEACIARAKTVLALAKEVGLDDSEQFDNIQRILETIDPHNVEHETLLRLDEALRRFTGVDAKPFDNNNSP